MRPRKPLGITHPASYRRSLVFQWLDSTKITSDATGDMLFLMKKRVDMPRTFPTKGHMRQFMVKCGVGSAAIDHVFDRVWSMYRFWVDQARHDTTPMGVTLPPPSARKKHGETVSDNPWNDYDD